MQEKRASNEKTIKPRSTRADRVTECAVRQPRMLHSPSPDLSLLSFSLCLLQTLWQQKQWSVSHFNASNGPELFYLCRSVVWELFFVSVTSDTACEHFIHTLIVQKHYHNERICSHFIAVAGNKKKHSKTKSDLFLFHVYLSWGNLFK